MAEDNEQRGWTVLVLGGPGQPSRRYLVNHRAFGVLLIALLLGALGIGFMLGKGADARTAVASIASSHAAAPVPVVEPVPFVEPVIAAAPSPPAIPAPVVAVSTGGTAAPSPPSEPPAAAAPSARGAEVAAAAEGKPLLLLRSASSDEVVEVHPFAADGSPNASAFQLLETVMACGDGHHQAPDPALVRVLLEAQHEFDKPLVLLGGRCARHEDHPEAIEHHRAGRGADVRVRGISTEQLMSWLAKRGAGGAGRYKAGGYVHVDVRRGAFEPWRGEEPAAPKPAAKPAEAATPAEPAAAPETAPAEN